MLTENFSVRIYFTKRLPPDKCNPSRIIALVLVLVFLRCFTLRISTSNDQRQRSTLSVKRDLLSAQYVCHSLRSHLNADSAPEGLLVVLVLPGHFNWWRKSKWSTRIAFVHGLSTTRSLAWMLDFQESGVLSAKESLELLAIFPVYEPKSRAFSRLFWPADSFAISTKSFKLFVLFAAVSVCNQQIINLVSFSNEPVKREASYFVPNFRSTI